MQSHTDMATVFWTFSFERHEKGGQALINIFSTESHIQSIRSNTNTFKQILLKVFKGVVGKQIIFISVFTSVLHCDAEGIDRKASLRKYSNSEITWILKFSAPWRANSVRRARKVFFAFS